MPYNESCKTDDHNAPLNDNPKQHYGYLKYVLISFLMCVATALGLAYVLEYKDSQRTDELKLDIKNAMSDFYVSVKSGDTKTLDLMSTVMSRIDTQQISINELNSYLSQIRAETKEAIADAVVLASSNDQAMMRAVISEHMLRISSEDMAMRFALKSMDEELTAQRSLIDDLRNTINGRAGKTASEEAAFSLSYARSAKVSDRNLSELYYVKAITLMPNDILVISEYVDFVLSGVRNNDEITSVRDKLARSSSVVQAAIANADSDKVSKIREELDKINDRFKQ